MTPSETSPSRRLRRRESRASLSRASSVSGLSFPGTEFSRGSTPSSTFSPLQRHSSVTSIATITTANISEASCKFHLRDANNSIAYEPTDDTMLGFTAPLSWSLSNNLVFGRGNRVHSKNLNNSDAIPDGLLKVKEKHGTLRHLACAGSDAPNTLALSTSSGMIQLFDMHTRQIIRSFTTTRQPPTALCWSPNPSILSVGGEKGHVRHFDTRIKESAKMKEQARRVTRHQALIWSIAWREDGLTLASGDGSGVVLCWDARMNSKGDYTTPLDVGDMDKRRRKMQHVGPVKALAFCPWQPKTLASGDAAPDGTGTIRLWNTDENHLQKPLAPNAVKLEAQITSFQWSTSCRELLSTHAEGLPPASPPPSTPLAFEDDFDWDVSFGSSASTPVFPTIPTPQPVHTGLANSISVHNFPHLNKMTTQVVGTGAVNGSAVSPNGQRVVLAIPGEKALKVWDVWGKRKTLTRQKSLVREPCGIR